MLDNDDLKWTIYKTGKELTANQEVCITQCDLYPHVQNPSRTLKRMVATGLES